MTKRACDGCRRRKVKCDAKDPRCSNCAMSSLACEYTVPAKKRGPPFKVHKDANELGIQTSNAVQKTMTQGASPDVIDSPPSNDAEAQVVCLSSPSVTAETRTSPFRGAQDELLSALGKALPYAPLEHVLSTCIDLYMQWEFPTGPVICEPMVRQAVPIVVPILRGETAIPSSSVTGPSTSDVSTIRAFALLTGMCAFVSSSLPSDFFAPGSALAWPFLRTSRSQRGAMLGVALVEIIHSVTNDAITARAKSLFGTLLDVLARLNSRVSDELSNDR
ncbi:C6 transcription factor [Colletotrichum kahawae]|uniref:C6 transcription factor n=1 Tax=Colletotrichum kahawae TaxID=34407 RepID=A0AAD9Y6N6_COLKA|nr:C6 transcription factor [Colletotrichum kahawae]